MAADPTERTALQRAASGDEQSYGLLFHQHLGKLYGLAYSFTKSDELAKDICQEVFLRIWHYREKLAEVENFEAWLITVAKNHIRNTLKKKVLVTRNEAQLLAHMQDSAPSVQQRLEWKEWEGHLREAVDRLPPQMQQVFRLSRFEGLSHAEIAERLQISRVTSQNHVARALALVRQYLLEKQNYLGLVLLFLVR
ncbi:MAG: RNA polymerase sigma-70 factor [Candidatus Pseudobacter hemicellulosilyticus]|uniref:RNA polymerase sigma-70 factor n=1 Tax=Candidatus Pseudobacter hemicellulosilyticus TaxID=3121375 RepID=A0AAJ5WT00_9BACT|nr:MAG: RNA polymerase sigma-70 factor [Pseudobacter sp.]